MANSVHETDVAIVGLIALIKASDSYYIFGARLSFEHDKVSFVKQCRVSKLKQLQLFMFWWLWFYYQIVGSCLTDFILGVVY